MRKLAFILVASLAFTACNDTEKRDHRDNAATDSTLPLLDTTNKAQAYTADVNLNGDEKVFLLNASLSLQRLAEFAHLASNSAADASLRNQATKMDKEYSKMLKDLQAIAKGKGLMLTKNDISELGVLKTQEQTAFETKYSELILQEHANLTKQLDNGTKVANADIKNFANNALTIVDQNNRNIAKALK